MTTAYWIIAALFAIVIGGCGLWCALLTMEMTDQVNSMLPREKQFPIIGSNWRFFALRSEYRRLFPEGSLLKQTNILFVIMFGSGIGIFTLLALLSRMSK